MKNKKYYWLKLKKDFFSQKIIKKLRKIAGGDTYTIIYLKMQLASIQNNGVLEFERVEDTFEEELALELDEELENVKMTLAYLRANNLIEIIQDDGYLLTEVPNIIGSETSSAERVREHRKNKKILESNEKALNSDNEIIQNDGKVLQCNTNVTRCNVDVTKCNTEIEKEIEKEIELEVEVEKKKDCYCSYDTKNYISSYCNKINPVASRLEMDKLISWEEDVSAELIEIAIDEAVLSNARNFKYINSILNRCLEQGITTVEQFKAEKEIRKQKRDSNNERRTDEKICDNPELAKRIRGTVL